MTCIIAARANDGTIVVGADGIGIDRSTMARRVTSTKIHRYSDLCLVGVAGSMRLMQLITKHVDESFVDMKDPTAAFIARLAEVIRVHDASLADSAVLLVVDGQISVIDADLAWTPDQDGIAAIGIGADIAVGYMLALRRYCPDLDMRHGVLRALEASASCNASVGPPFTVGVTRSAP